MKNKRYITFFSAGILAVVLQRNVININPLSTPAPTPTPTIKPVLKPNLIKNIDLIKLEFTNKRAELKNVKVTKVDAKGIIVDSDGTSIKVNLETNTHFRRKFWGKSNVGEISVGDGLDVIGRWANEAKTEINAVVIRDLSIQKRFGVFFGTVKTVTDSGFIMTTIQRGNETVTLDTAKLINRKGQTITSSDIQVGDRIRVRGMWDSANFTVTEVTEVKDFSLPVVPTTTP